LVRTARGAYDRSVGTATSSVRRLAIRAPGRIVTSRGTPIVAAPFHSAEDFLFAYDDVPPAGELAVVTRAKPASGSDVVLEIEWPGLPNSVFLRAKVTRRPLGLLARLHSDGVPTRDFLLRIARDARLPCHPRQHRRYAVHLPLVWRRFGEYDFAEGVAEDLSLGGIQIATASPAPRPGERISLRIAGQGDQDFIVSGAVRHARSRTGDHCFGAEFIGTSSGEVRRLRHLIRSYAARGLSPG
jgi:hypothetical protein